MSLEGRKGEEKEQGEKKEGSKDRIEEGRKDES